MAVKKISPFLIASALLAAQASSALVLANDKTSPAAEAAAAPAQWQCVASGTEWKCDTAAAPTGPYAKPPLPVHTDSSATAVAGSSDRSDKSKKSKLVKTASQKEAAKLDWVPLDELPPDIAAQTPAMCEGAYVEPIIASTAGVGVSTVDSPVQVSAAQTSFVEGVYTLSGDVLIKQGQQQVESNEATYDQNSNITSLSGDIRYRQPNLLVLGNKASMDLNQGEVKVDNSQFVVHSAHARGAADEVTKQGDNVIRIENGIYTSCPPNSNTWTLRSPNIKINPNTGWGSATNATLNVKDVPVLYTPYIYFPIDDRRQSGLLYPKISVTSGNGFDLATPYYFNLAPNYDATYTPRYMVDRGFLNEGQFRYLTQWGEGDLGVGYIGDDKDYGDNRYIDNWNHKTSLDNRWSTLVDYTHVSDNDYFRDFGTDLNTKRKSELNQLGQVKYAGDNWQFLGAVHEYQTIDNEIAEDDKPYGRLPQLVLEADMPGYAGLQYLWRSEYDYFTRNLDESNPTVSAADGDLVEGNRFQATPGIRLPMEFSWGYLTPQTQINLAKYELSNNADGYSNSIDRAIPTTSIDTGLFFDRVTTIGGAGYHQTLEPRIYGAYTPYHNQNDVPLFDTSEMDMTYQQLFRSNRFTGNDRIADDQHVTVGLSTRFLADESGVEKFRAGIGRAFYAGDNKVSLDTPSTSTKEAPLASEIVYRIDDDWRMQMDAVTDSEDESNDLRSVNFHYNPALRKILNFGYSYRNQETDGMNNLNQSNVSFSWPMNPQWSVLGQWRYDIASGSNLESLFGFEYDSCCWGVRLVGRRHLNEDVNGNTDEVVSSNYDNGVYLQFEFKGLGSLGKKSDGVVSESIYGYHTNDEQSYQY